MVYITQHRRPLTLATLISERCRELGLTQAEFVSRVGDRDIRKGIRLLHQLFNGDTTRMKAMIESISTTLDLPEQMIYQAAELSQQVFNDRKRRGLERERLAERTDACCADQRGPDLKGKSGPKWWWVPH
jgi:transcriptional regulator with XRE-family HTH domain